MPRVGRHYSGPLHLENSSCSVAGSRKLVFNQNALPSQAQPSAASGEPLISAHIILDPGHSHARDASLVLVSGAPPAFESECATSRSRSIRSATTRHTKNLTAGALLFLQPIANFVLNSIQKIATEEME